MATGAKKKGQEIKDQAEYLTPAEFARLFKLGRSTVQSMMDSGSIQTIPIPTADPNAKKKLRRIPVSEVKRIQGAAR